MTDSRPIMARALDAVPRYAQLTAALDALAAHVDTLTPPTSDPAADLAAEVRDAVIEGRPIPDDLGRRIIEAEEDTRRRRAEGALIGVTFGVGGSGLAGQLLHERDQAVHQHVDAALRVLADELTRIVAAVAEVDQTLGTIATVDAAVAAGDRQAAAWRTLGEAVNAYDALRSAQAEILRRAGGDLAQVRRDLEDGGYHRSALDVDPLWQAKLDGTLETEHGVISQEVSVARAPWPAARPSRGSGHWPTTDRPAYLRWIAVGPAQPWVPSRRELRMQLDDLEAAVRDAAAARAKPPGPPVERQLIALGIESRARRH
jgi:hypothetical protein